MAASAEQIAETPGIGPKVAALIHEQLRDPDMIALVEDLKGLGLQLESEGAPPGEGALGGKTLVLTGTLPDLTREEATERILAAGGRVTTSRVEEDRLRHRRRVAGLEAREGRAARRAGARRGGVGGAARRRLSRGRAPSRTVAFGPLGRRRAPNGPIAARSRTSKQRAAGTLLPPSPALL